MVDNKLIIFQGQFQIEDEDYYNVKDALVDILLMIENIKSVEIDGINYNLDFYFGADYKMLRLIYGQKASNANEACIYCKTNLNIPMETPVDKNLEYSIFRSIEDTPDNFEPILKFIDYKRVVIDLLHMFLRITDFLYEIILNKLSKMDNNNTGNMNARPNLKIFLEFLKSRCKITNASFVQEGQIRLRNLNRNERLKIFRELVKKEKENLVNSDEDLNYRRSFGNIFQYKELKSKNRRNHFDFEIEYFVWQKFYRIYLKLIRYDIKIENIIEILKKEKDLTKIREMRKLEKIKSISSLKEQLKVWLDSYVDLSIEYRGIKTISPYIHIFVFHLVELLDIHGNINLFNVQGLEKLNHFCIEYYHHCTNKNSSRNKYLAQLLKKRNRVEFLKLREFNYDPVLFSEEENEDD